MTVATCLLFVMQAIKSVPHPMLSKTLLSLVLDYAPWNILRHYFKAGHDLVKKIHKCRENNHQSQLSRYFSNCATCFGSGKRVLKKSGHVNALSVL